MGRINQLDRSVYNRISAGEVVENPAAVVKELVENAIDAGATEIGIEIEEGGKKSIFVSDNGCGIEEEDLELAVMPHATSKIFYAEDLDTVSTLGFRGEALASICAVSKTTIRSRFASEEGPAAFITVEGGEIVSTGKCNLQKGTSIEVNSLFYNTPARARFLKTTKGETASVTKLIGELILANPDITISYVADGETIYSADGSGMESAVCTVFGMDVHDCMVGFYISEKGYTVSGFACRAASAGIKANRNREVFIVNGRSIEDSTMQAVIANAYGDRLMRRTYPTVVVDIVLPFEDVDVNVHPNKREVRFADTKRLYGLVYTVIKNALEEDEEYQRKAMLAALRGEEPAKKEPVIPSDAETTEKDDVDLTPQEYLDKYYKFTPMSEIIDENGNLRPDEENNDQSLKSEAERLEWLEGESMFVEDDKCFPQFIGFADSNPPEEPVKKASYRVIGQLFDTYVLVETGDTLLMIDQHAAHERMLYDKFSEEIKNKVIVQDLLLPVEAVLEESGLRFFADHTEEFKNLGFELEIKGESLFVKSVPTVLIGMDILSFIATVNEGSEMRSITDSTVFKDKLAQTACKSAIKGGDRMDEAQLKYFIEEYIKSDAPIQCPHGRPTGITLTRTKIEKLFGRKV